MLVDGFRGQFAVGPGIHRPLRLQRWGAGQVDDLDNLFGGEGIGRAGARRIGEDGGDSGAQVGLMAFDRRQRGLGGSPAGAPEADGGGRTAQLRRNRFIALPTGGGEDNLDATDECLRRGLLAQQTLQDGLLGRRDRK